LALGRSKFRGRFRLRGLDAEYYKEKGLEVILTHGREFIRQRLGGAWTRRINLRANYGRAMVVVGSF
jgi:hypothetical protein